jgi:hypothetical protein
MDQLWVVAGHVLSDQEVDRLSPAEAFLLSAGFYLHDIGMAYAATSEGLTRIQASQAYISARQSLAQRGVTDSEGNARAVAIAVRHLHASAAAELATNVIPGTSIYIIEPRAIRETWGRTCGTIANSHHWDLDKLDRELGLRGTHSPMPGNRQADLAFVAAALRLIDYAHINRDRAPAIDRAFRPPIERDSLVHWLAQEQIDGPIRNGMELVYRSAEAIGDVDAWWLYYGMLTGLDAEIRAVRRYLDRRPISQGRLTLQGIRGSASPEEASEYIRADGFLPIEVNLRTGSIERVVQLLAGESLYGPDPMAAVRELIQNARDAVLLKGALATAEVDRAILSLPIRVILKTTPDTETLEVIDNGIGMNRNIMTNFLITIASDYWRSQFYSDFPSATEKGFKPAGKFGIGFLSVFMLGDAVSVESNRAGDERTRLSLRGVGRRGELLTISSAGGSGTRVTVKLKQSVVDIIRNLPDLVRVYAPMLSHPIDIDVDGVKTHVAVDWFRSLSSSDFRKWTLGAAQTLTRTRSPKSIPLRDFERIFVLRGLRSFYQKPDDPWDIWTEKCPEYVTPEARLVASFEGTSLLCLRGLAIQSVSTPGFVGLINLDSAVTDASRRQIITGDISQIISEARRITKSEIVGNLDAVKTRGLLIEQMPFLAQCAETYGREVLRESSLAWISALKMPGEVELISCATLIERLARSTSIFIAHGTGPWTAMRSWVKLGPASSSTEPAIVIDDSGHYAPPYHSGQEKVATLALLWPQSESSPLFSTILGLACEAWQVTPHDLVNQEGWRQNGSTVWGRLMRP